MDGWIYIYSVNMLNSSLKQKREGDSKRDGYDFSLEYLLISNEPSTYSKPVTQDFNQPCAELLKT